MSIECGLVHVRSASSIHSYPLGMDVILHPRLASFEFGGHLACKGGTIFRVKSGLLFVAISKLLPLLGFIILCRFPNHCRIALVIIIRIIR